jgi:2-polyprenyl-3-methyl-5-hydroxy-6-metoxy-1,4-benzoquinol methylase
LDLETIDAAALGAMRPSAFVAGQAAGPADGVVRGALLEDFPRIRELLPEAYYLDRLGSAIFYRMPWLLGLGKELSRLNVVEFGCGQGLKAIPWSRLFRSYLGVDLNAEVIDFARRLARHTRRPNLEFRAGNAADVVRHPQAFGITGRIDVVVLYAVVEHLTPPERKQVLGLCRDILQDGGLVILCETPNRLIPQDGHSTFLHFFQMLPPEIALEYIKRSPRPDAVAAVSDEESLYRWGQGVSYHEFDLWMSDAAGRLPGILTDGWSHWPLCDNPLRRDELALNEYLHVHAPLAPPAFARFWLDMVFDGSAAAGSSPAVPMLPEPDPLLNAGVFPGKEYDVPPLLGVNEAGHARISLSGGKPVLLLDLNQSAGEVAVEDARGATLAVLSVEALRRSRFPRWHGSCAVDLSALGSRDEITLRPLGRGSKAVSTGVVIR